MGTLFLGVDGGGSGCRAAVCDAAGTVLGRGAAGPANIWTDPDGARRSVLAAAAAALADGPGGDARALHAVLGLAGANLPDAAHRMAAGLPFARVRVVTDAAIALRGAIGGGDGVMAALGTGSVFGVRRAGRERIVGGWGFLLGDQASGAWLGRRLLERALLAHDDMSPGSPLLTAAVAEAGGPAALVTRASAWRPADFAALVPRLLAAAAEGDAEAEAVLREGDAAVLTALDALEAGPALPVVFVGGLGAIFERRLADRLAGGTRAPAGTPLDGALAMAREAG